MRHHLVILAAGALLLGCTSSDPAVRSAANPYHACHAQGIPYGSPELQDCIEQRIVAQCTTGGHAEGSSDYERCERSLRDVVLVTRNMELWGYRLPDQRPFN
jgi:hypothetical protein